MIPKPMNLLFRLSAVCLMAAPLTARAQDEFGGQAPDLVAPQGESEAAPAPQGTPDQGLETHVVKPGDTLWDLSGKYLNNSWYWPKVWSYNPQLSNPHWIFPGNELRFHPGDENLPTQVDVSREMAQPDSEPLNEIRPLSFIPTTKASVRQSHSFFVSQDAHAQAGRIVNAESEARMLTIYDKVYMKLTEPRSPGETLVVYQTRSEIEHPDTGEHLGYAVEVVGRVRVLKGDDKLAKGVLVAAYRPIARGDYVGAWSPETVRRVQPNRPTAQIHGKILATAGDPLGSFGQHTMVFIDRGSRDGVKKGNVFQVYDRMDGYTKEQEGIPRELWGEIMVLDVQEKASTAMITRSVRELTVGDTFESGGRAQSAPATEAAPEESAPAGEAAPATEAAPAADAS